MTGTENRNQRSSPQFDEFYGRNRKTSAGESRPKSGQSGGRHQKPKQKLSIAAVIGIDVLCAALIMLLFFITSYVIQPESTGSSLPAPSNVSAAEMPSTTDGGSTTDPANAEGTDPAAQTTTQPDTAADTTSWRVKFADKFTSGNVEKTDMSYKDANINVSINKVQKDSITYFLADIYVADIQYFKTAFAKQPDVMGGREATNVVAQANNAILAINGDHCVDNNGPVVRNGQLFREEKYADALVMNYDGSMQTYSADALDMNAIKANGAWQVWTFGPMLLKDGQKMTEFNSTLKKANPRTAVGYYEPGHYCFLVVDGRQAGYSDGMTLEEMSKFFYDSGCKVAFNLDGGQSSEMVFMGTVINKPYDGGRSTNDILYITAQ
ncbi:MAG: phosphodiester glycosidase family protein [Eubacteriales bacterium]|nr:phosphodiester glycosidase family protein [Eubacteriales bacterium]